MRGVESLAGELWRQTSQGVHRVFAPLGAGGLCAALCRGFAALSTRPPKVLGVQPEGCPTVLEAFREGREEIRAVLNRTEISGLGIPYDIDASLALRLLRENGGGAVGVNDEEIYEAQQMLLQQEGIYAEPAGAAALAGLRQAASQGKVGREETVACLVTGSGFKDPPSIRRAGEKVCQENIEAAELRPRLASILG
jgi:threonine synthase